MKRIYTYGHEQVERNITISDIIENKKNRVKMTQVTAQNSEEAEILSDQNIERIQWSPNFLIGIWVILMKFHKNSVVI